MLSQVKLNIPDALAELQRVDALGPDPDNSEFRALNTSQCKEICEFVPSIFQKE